MKKACIILNGKADNYDKIKNTLVKEKYDYIICADGGANHLYSMGIIPHYIIGDLDSIKDNIIKYYKEKNVEFKKFPSKKNETDTQLCIHLAKELNVGKIDFYFALGGRIDHTLANINLLKLVKDIKIIPSIISEKEKIQIVINEEIDIFGKKGETISVIPIMGDAIGVTLENLEYPLYNYDMKFGLSLGISNVMLENSCRVKVKDGTLLIIKNN